MFRRALRAPRLSLETKFVLAIGTVISLLILLLFFWTSQRMGHQILEQVDKQARILWTQLVLTRQWVAENRDIVRDVPAVVTKKLSQKAEDEGLYQFHITSLRLINPENAPNDFEQYALRQFEQGVKEATRIEREGGIKVYRYMAPLYVTEACLQCHEYQSYRVGDVRGGLSVMIPMQEADDAIASTRLLLSLYALVVLAILLGALYLLVRRLVLAPLHHLHEVAVRIEAGSYDTRSQVRTGDELEHLGNAFNRMMAAVAEARSFDEAVLENIASGVLTVDGEGQLTFVNRTAAQLFGTLRREEVTRLKRELLETRAGLLPGALHDGQTRVLQEIKLKRWDGRRLTVSISTSPLRNAEGEVIGAVGVITDLTELRAMDEQKAHLDRLAALGKLAGSIAHEINNPLQGILSGLGLVADDGCDPEQRRLYFTVIREEVERIANTIHQMLDFYRPIQDVGTPTEVRGLVLSVLALVRKQLQTCQVKVVTDLDPQLPQIVAVGSQIRQVVLNVVLNAIEAMPQGGELRVATRSLQDPSGKGAGSLLIEIGDTGVGIPRRQLRRIFDPFYTTKPKGTGLGLSVSFGIIKSHGGTITVNSQEGRGSTFTISLPAMESSAASPGEARPVEEEKDVIADTRR